MIRLEETIIVPRAQAEAFAYIAAFENVAAWDPGVIAAERTTPDNVGVGAVYRITARFRNREIPMTYRTVAHDPPRRVVLEGDGANIHARDEIVFEPNGPAATRITYRATFQLRWPWRLLEWPLRPTFRRLGDDALRGMHAALDDGAPTAPDDPAPSA